MMRNQIVSQNNCNFFVKGENLVIFWRKFNIFLNKDEVEVLDEKRSSSKSSMLMTSWPQTIQDLKNNNNQQPLIYPRPTSDLLRPPFLNPFSALSARFGNPAANPATAGTVGPLGFPNWVPMGVVPPTWPQNYPIGRGHELMRRLCTMNPSFAQSIIEDYIRPQVSLFLMTSKAKDMSDGKP